MQEAFDFFDELKSVGVEHVDLSVGPRPEKLRPLTVHANGVVHVSWFSQLIKPFGRLSLVVFEEDKVLVEDVETVSDGHPKLVHVVHLHTSQGSLYHLRPRIEGILKVRKALEIIKRLPPNLICSVCPERNDLEN